MVHYYEHFGKYTGANEARDFWSMYWNKVDTKMILGNFDLSL
jgi:hypothetical protein